ncbi:MAG: hypothetical protein WAQ24_02275 [Candidatus Saccharimonadales bacterium]
MKVTQFLRGSLSLVVWAIAIQGVAFFYDAFFNIRPSHPVWNPQFNWLPVITAVVIGAMVVTATRMYMAHRGFTFRPKSVLYTYRLRSTAS